MSISESTSSSRAVEVKAGTGKEEDAMLKIWLDGEFVNEDEAKVDVFDHGVLYGDGCFEGIRVYNNRIFKLQSHIDRLFHSAEAIRLKIPYSKKEIENAIREGVKRNHITNGYIRPVVTRGKGNLGINPYQCARPCVSCSVKTSNRPPTN